MPVSKTSPKGMGFFDMNTKQLELFQKVLEQMETNLQENLNGDVQDYAFGNAQECLDGLMCIAEVLDNINFNEFDTPVNPEDLGYSSMTWVIGELFKDTDEGTDFIEAINEDLEICTDEDVKGLISELLDM